METLWVSLGSCRDNPCVWLHGETLLGNQELVEWWERGVRMTVVSEGGKVLGYLLGQSRHPLLFLFHIKHRGNTPVKRTRLLFATDHLPSLQSPPKRLHRPFPALSTRLDLSTTWKWQGVRWGGCNTERCAISSWCGEHSSCVQQDSPVCV